MFQKKFVEKTKTHTHRLLNNYLSENRAVYILWGKYCRAGKATDDNMAHAHCMLDT